MNKWIKLGIGIFAALIVLSLGYYLFPKSYIKIAIAPDQAQLSIDGGHVRNISSGSTILVIAGKHTYTISRDQFDPTTITITSANNETKTLTAALNPRTDAAKNLLTTTNSLTVIEQIGNSKERQGEKTVTDNYPILQDLPIIQHSYEIDACQSQKYPNDPTKIALCVYSGDPAGVQPLVNDELTQLGFKPSDYEIIYEPAD